MGSSDVAPEDKLLFACCRQNFTERHQQTVTDFCRTAAVSWPRVYATALEHGVAPLVYLNLRQCPTSALNLPHETATQLKQRAQENAVFKQRLAEQICRGLAFFHEMGIDAMLIKGAALDALVYDNPWYTTPQDIDLVIRTHRAELSDGAQQEVVQFFHGSGIEFDYFEHHDVVMNGVLPVDFHRIWADASRIEFQGQAAWVMSPEDLLISLCINSCRKRFFRLKSLCDIAETAGKYSDRLNWPGLIRKARAYGCTGIVFAALWVTQMTVGCRLPDALLDGLNLNPIRARIIRVLSQSMCPAAFSSLHSGRRVLGRRIDVSLLLAYATYGWPQVWRKMGYVWRTRSQV